MKHREYVRIVPGARTAVLLIHGIVGTPDHFRELLPLERVVPEDWSVYNLLLPGHGGSTKDFGNASMERWKRKVWRVFEALSVSHERIVVVGHSMGALFAIQLGLEFPHKIAFLYLIAAPMRPYLGVWAAINSIRLVAGAIRPDHPREAAIAAACGAEPTVRLWEYIPWIPRFAELFREVGQTRRRLGRLTVPCECWQSGRDELVMVSACRVLDRSGRVAVHLLPDSSHFYYTPEEKQIVIRAFREKCAGLTE